MSRGPFATSRDWLYARLQLLLHDCSVILGDPDSDGDTKEDSFQTQAMVYRLQKLLPSIFPTEKENFAPRHDALSAQNILVGQDGALKAVVDWECTSTMPLFMCCQLPYVLQSNDRSDEPEIET